MSEMQGLNREKLIEADIIHDEDHESNHERLSGFYGLVSKKQNEFLCEFLGSNVLDVGAGYGNLTREILNSGRNAVGLEVDVEKVVRAKDWFEVDLCLEDFHNLEDVEYDTIVFREVLNHLNLESTFAKAFQLTTDKCVIFQGTEILPLRLAKSFYGHREYDQKTPQMIIEGLQQAGFEVSKVVYRDVLAFPMSGGWWGHRWIRSQGALGKLILNFDAVMSSIVNVLGLGSFFSFRVLIEARKP